MWFQELNLAPLEVQPVLLTLEPSLQPHSTPISLISMVFMLILIVLIRHKCQTGVFKTTIEVIVL